MKNIVMLLVLVVLGAGTVAAQEVGVVFHPGETVHILVTFKTPPNPVEAATFGFGLVGQPEKAQEPLGQGFQGSQFKKISDAQFEISGTIPDHTASGNFKLNWINIGIKGVGKQYNEGADFKGLTIRIINPEHPEFPAIDDVKLTPRN